MRTRKTVSTYSRRSATPALSRIQSKSRGLTRNAGQATRPNKTPTDYAGLSPKQRLRRICLKAIPSQANFNEFTDNIRALTFKFLPTHRLSNALVSDLLAEPMYRDLVKELKRLYPSALGNDTALAVLRRYIMNHLHSVRSRMKRSKSLRIQASQPKRPLQPQQKQSPNLTLSCKTRSNNIIPTQESEQSTSEPNEVNSNHLTSAPLQVPITSSNTLPIPNTTPPARIRLARHRFQPVVVLRSKEAQSSKFKPPAVPQWVMDLPKECDEQVVHILTNVCIPSLADYIPIFQKHKFTNKKRFEWLWRLRNGRNRYVYHEFLAQELGMTESGDRWTLAHALEQTFYNDIDNL